MKEQENLPGIQIDELTVSKLGFTRHLRNSIEGSLTDNVGMLKYSPEYLPLSYDSICNLAHFLNIYIIIWFPANFHNNNTYYYTRFVSSVPLSHNAIEDISTCDLTMVFEIRLAIFIIELCC